MTGRNLEGIRAAAGRFVSHAENLITYGTDGCTGVPELNITHCCERHDVDYRSGRVSRWTADYRLRCCMQAKGWRFLPWIYWCGVRLFGRRFYRYDRRRSYLRTIGRADG